MATARRPWPPVATSTRSNRLISIACSRRSTGCWPSGRKSRQRADETKEIRMTNEFSSPGEASRPPGSAWRRRLSELRHDLRNPLSEIVGFAELLIEEARERQLRTLMPGLDTIRQSANRILADLNHALNPDTLRLSPEVLKSLNETVRRLSEDILGTSQNLSDQCDELGQATLGEDFLRISGSARRLREMAPAALDGLIGQGSGRADPIEISAGSAEESA